MGCNFVDVAVSLSPALSEWGLPNVINKSQIPSFELQGPTTVCSYQTPEVFVAQIPNTNCFSDSVIWTYSGSGTITDMTNTSLSIEFTTPGTDMIIAEIAGECYSIYDTIIVECLDCSPLEDTVVCATESAAVVLDATTTGALSYLWDDGSTSAQRSVSVSGQYLVDVVLGIGLTFSDSASVSFLTCDCSVEFPTAFTPNGDLSNDLFRPIYESSCDITNYELKIFNRFGQKVFESSNPAEGWDAVLQGQAQARDVYMYTSTYTITETGEPTTKTMRGTVALLR